MVPAGVFKARDLGRSPLSVRACSPVDAGERAQSQRRSGRPRAWTVRRTLALMAAELSENWAGRDRRRRGSVHGCPAGGVPAEPGVAIPLRARTGVRRGRRRVNSRARASSVRSAAVGSAVPVGSGPWPLIPVSARAVSGGPRRHATRCLRPSSSASRAAVSVATRASPERAPPSGRGSVSPSSEIAAARRDHGLVARPRSQSPIAERGRGAGPRDGACRRATSRISSQAGTQSAQAMPAGGIGTRGRRRLTGHPS